MRERKPKKDSSMLILKVKNQRIRALVPFGTRGKTRDIGVGRTTLEKAEDIVTAAAEEQTEQN